MDWLEIVIFICAVAVPIGMAGVMASNWWVVQRMDDLMLDDELRRCACRKVELPPAAVHDSRHIVHGQERCAPCAEGIA